MKHAAACAALACAGVTFLEPASPASAARLTLGGASAALRSAAVIGTVPSVRRLHLTVTLRPRDPAALAAYARAVSTPGSAVYRQFLTPAQFGRRFGAGSGRAAIVRHWLRSRGLRPGPTSRGGLSISLSASVGALERGLGISLERLALPGGRRALAARAPVVPATVAGAVQSLIGLDSVSARQPLAARPALAPPPPLSAVAHPPLTRALATRVSTGAPQPCAEARNATAQGAHTQDQIASAYGFSGLYAAGDRGAGTTVAMYELEPVGASDLAAYASCYGIQPSIGYVRVDGGAGSGIGTDEAAFDIESFISLAPAARVLVYEGPNSNSGNPGSGPYDIFSAIVNQDRAQVVSVSWGECEAALGSTDARSEDVLFAQAAIEGQTFVAAAGDSGSEDCNTGSAPPRTQLAVDDPASQPFVTSVGGTTLSSLGPRPSESVWNDVGNVAGSTLQPGAGGGGISSLWAMPAAQRGAAASLNVLGAGPSGARCGAGGGYCRQVPDVAADANPATGYVIYWNGSHRVPGQPGGWQAIGGTSGGAPVWAALFALADASAGCAEAPLGDALPALYRAAGSNYHAYFNDVQSGNNDFTATNGGQFAAAPGYDEASGLGTPNAAALVPALCANALRLSDPGAQRSAAGATVSLTARVTDAQGTAVRFRSRGLPPGLKLTSSTGRIRGQLRRRGSFQVTLTASDAQTQFGRRFTWTVGGATRVRALVLSGVGSQTPVLSFNLAAGAGAPSLQGLRFTLPAGLQASSLRGLRLTSGGAPVVDRAQLVAGTIFVTLRRGYRTVLLTLGLGAAARNPRARGGGPVPLTVQVTDMAGGISQVRGRATQR